MEEELQVHRLPRFEKKRLVKGWHVTQAPSSNSTSTLIGEATESGSLRSLFAPPPAALAYETQRTETWRSVNFYTTDHDGLQNQEQGDTIPKTVAQVKQMYRVRARRQEERDATNAIRKREKILELRRGPRWRNQLSKSKVQKQQSTTVDLQRQDEIKEGEKTVISPQNDFNQELQLIDLPVDEVVTNAT